MRSAISEDTHTGDAGRIIALSQGITDEREICLFMDALTEEYNNSKSYSEAKVFLDSMLDFVRKPEDDFIIGRTHAFCDGSTAIYSDERLPNELHNADVEIRLKKIEKPLMKGELITNMCVSPMHSLRTFGCNSRDIIYPNEDLKFPTMCGRFAGKKVKITIEELKE